MFVVRDSEHVRAPLERCFQLATHLGLVSDVLQMEAQQGEGLRTAGLVKGGDRIHWYGRKWGVPHRHVSRITRFEPDFFQDVMEQGRFKRFEHDHHFTTVGEHTVMRDYVRFSMPFGVLGRLVGKYVVLPHVVRLLRMRLMLLKRIAESDDWRRYLAAS